MRFFTTKATPGTLFVALFFAFVFVTGISCFRDYGISWDDPIQRDTGAVTYKYLAERFFLSSVPDSLRPLPALADWKDRDYGVAFETPAVALEVLFGFRDSRSIYLFRHLLTFLVSFAGLYAVYCLAKRRFGDWKFGLLTALFLFASPRFFADSFYNTKDIVFMAVFAIAMNASIPLVLKPSYKNSIVAALATAIAIDVRVMAILLVVLTAAISLIRTVRNRSALWSTMKPLASYAITTGILTVAFFPWLWSDPVGNFLQAIGNMSHFRKSVGVLYMGQLLNSTALPWHYSVVWIIITTPIMYSVLFCVGVARNVKHFAAKGYRLDISVGNLQDLFFLGAFFCPILAVIVNRSVLYDGWRQLYFIYPSFLLISTAGFLALYKQHWMEGTPRKGLLAITAASIATTLLWMWRAHPLQNVYFNFLAGQSVRTRFDMDYWGLGNRKALEHILTTDHSLKITIREISYTPLSDSLLILKPEDRSRLDTDAKNPMPKYLLSNYRITGVQVDPEVSFFYEDYYDEIVCGETILTLFRLKRQYGR